MTGSSLENAPHPERYNPKTTEPHWQAAWDAAQAFKAPDMPRTDKKYYVLEMFPYPSGKLHMGHVRNYTIGDIIARMKLAQGFDVLHPMGWDASGLPAENAAMERGVDPAEWTYDNIDAMREQMKLLGLSLDWSREVATCDPLYLKHQQKIFLDFLKEGLAYQDEAEINWDPKDQCVVANEEVVDGRADRSGALVEKRMMRQWFMKITHYVDELLDGIDDLDQWPEKVRLMQRNWIGRSQGVKFYFNIKGDDRLSDAERKLYVYTTRPDTIMGTSFCCLAPEHPLSLKIAEQDPEAKAFIEECAEGGTSEASIEKKEKKGYKTHLLATHPFTKEEMPVYIANFILMGYGTGAIKSAPAHDERDFAFATKYGLPIRPVITGPDFVEGEPYPTKGTVVNSGEFDGLTSDEAIEAVINKMEGMGIGQRQTNYRLRDWCISRQRYWGCPIPVVHCDECGAVPVPADQLPITLPKDPDYSKAGNPLNRMEAWVNTSCPECGKAAKRETDTMGGFVDSSWYQMRFADPHNEAQPFDAAKADAWLGVDQYIGGIEHAVMHLLYARFFTRALRDCGYQKTAVSFDRLFTQGMLTHRWFKDQDGNWLYPEEVEQVGENTWQHVETGASVVAGDIIKMSKSKRNTVDPLDMLDRYGADACRLFVVSDSPPEKDVEWTSGGIDGSWRFVNKFWRQVHDYAAVMAPVDMAKPSAFSDDAAQVRSLTHKAIAEVTESLEGFQFNVAIAKLRSFNNDLAKIDMANLSDDPSLAWALREAVSSMVQMWNPLIPHMTEELWRALGHTESLVKTPWPTSDASLVMDDTVTLPVQVNGKLRATVTLPKDADKATIESLAMAEENVQKFLAGKEIRKVIVVPGRVVNVVVG